jgi:hypothetical protein
MIQNLKTLTETDARQLKQGDEICRKVDGVVYVDAVVDIYNDGFTLRPVKIGDTNVPVQERTIYKLTVKDFAGLYDLKQPMIFSYSDIERLGYYVE